jgi:hypothetical protein
MAKTLAREIVECLWEFPAALVYGIRHDIIQARICRRLKTQGKGADLHGVKLLSASLPGVCLEGANLEGADLYGSDLHGADLANVNLSCAGLYNTNLQGANLLGANLSGASLTGTNLQNACLVGANLTGAWLWRTGRCLPSEFLRELTPDQQQERKWVSPNLAGADLTGAVLIGTDLIDADLTGTKLAGAIADARTRWPEDFDLRSHGVEIPSFPSEWRLKHAGVVLGTIHNCCPDYLSALPWFRGQFAAEPAFQSVQLLFDEMVRLRNAGRLKEYYGAYEPVRALKLVLESPSGETIDPYFLHIEGEEVRFRY